MNQTGYKDLNGLEVREGAYVRVDDIVELLGYGDSSKADQYRGWVGAGSRAFPTTSSSSGFNKCMASG